MLADLKKRLKLIEKYRSFLIFTVSREFKTRYTQSLLGVSWLVFEPMILVVTLTTVFTLIGRKSPDGIPFAVYFYSALLPWQFFTSLFSGGTNCFVGDKGLMLKIPFPKEISVINRIAIAFIDFLFANIAFVAILIFYGFLPNKMYLLLPLYLLNIALLGGGFMFLLGTIQVYIRDVGILVKSITTFWFWFTPIIFQYPFEGKTKIVYYVNPMAGIINGYRQAITHASTPPIEQLYAGWIWTIAVFILGYAVFRKYEGKFADVI